ncbi:MAG TPA: NHLP leader peptide family RiPP precursor [Stellaceae bacterium]|nr:NHLP leader peptide family RiPP precursor [Stellaceae bacterium]
MSSDKAIKRSTEQQNAQTVIAKAWADPRFKSSLLKDANAALASLGIATPPGVTIKVVEDTPTERHYVLPPRPESELHDELLERVVGGVGSASPKGKQ